MGDRSGPGALVLLIPLALFAGCSREPAESEPVVTVETATAARGPMADIVTADAVLYPLRQAAIVPKISAPVERFYVQRGDHVHAGQVLVVLEHQDLAAAAAQSQGQYEQAQAASETTRQANVPADLKKAQLDVTTTKQALDAAQKVYDDRKMLFDQGAIPRRDLDSAGVTLAQAQSDYQVAQQHLDALQSVTQAQTLKSAEAQLQAAKGQYEAAEAQLSYATIRSPIDGYVTDRPFYAGEMAQPGTPLLTVMDTSAVVARAPVPASEAGAVNVDDAATVQVPGAAKPADGRVTVVSPALDPASTTMQVWVQVPNPDGQLKPGTSVRVMIVARTIPDAVVVPAAALATTEDGGRSVMIVGEDHKAHAHPVDVGITQDDRVQVTSGVQPGDTVVTTGAYGLEDGTTVQVQGAASSPAPAER
jgi:HlyD family secretion protein